MNNTDNGIFLLHVSDFHLTDHGNEDARHVLELLSSELLKRKYRIKYLIHTGDIVDSSSAPKFKVIRHGRAKEILEDFIKKLYIPSQNVIICCGNHDIVRTSYNASCDALNIADGQNKPAKYICDSFDERFDNYYDLLKHLNVANQDRDKQFFPFEDIDVLVLNTNTPNPNQKYGSVKNGYNCVNCPRVCNTISEQSKYYSENGKLHIIAAHKPIYEICEAARLPWHRYRKTTFMSSIHDYSGANGIYLCGDKHTRSISASSFHDIPHFFAGEPLKDVKDGGCVEYNLLEICNGAVGMGRKIHLQKDSGEWSCSFRPLDGVVNELYQYSRYYIIKNAIDIICKGKQLNSWERVYQVLMDLEEEKIWNERIDCIDAHYKSICKYRQFGKKNYNWDSNSGKHIFTVLLEDIEKACNNTSGTQNNILNIKGEHGSGKSTFLGLFYIYMLRCYSEGSIDFIPAYFNLENEDIQNKVKKGFSYHDAVKSAFDDFTVKIERISQIQKQFVCYLIDGLDEEDCWSRNSEDSAGRALLDILALYPTSKYIISYSQHYLPFFKNTMPQVSHSDTSHVLFFNPISVQEEKSIEKKDFSNVKSVDVKMSDYRFFFFSYSFLQLRKEYTTDADYCLNDVCSIIRKFNRLTINPQFMNDNLAYILEVIPDSQKLKHLNDSTEELYSYYIEHCNEQCQSILGYGFIEYAPVMSYLFSYKGYTYGKFLTYNENNRFNELINKNKDKIYSAFLLIKDNSSVREYLIALHYNIELRYYADNANIEIDPDSILNEFISQPVSYLIRLLWNDTNKFIIAFKSFLQRNTISSCAQSMLIYILANLQNMYPPIADRLKNLQYEKLYPNKQVIDWSINENDSYLSLNRFFELNRLKSSETFLITGKSNTLFLVEKLINNSVFAKYNRLFQMAYYEDLTVKGEKKSPYLDPKHDFINKGFDFINCFKYLYNKLEATSTDKWEKHLYYLKDYDVFTLCDLVYSRFFPEETGTEIRNEVRSYYSVSTYSHNSSSRFFPGEKQYNKDSVSRIIDVLSKTISIVDKYSEYLKKQGEECNAKNIKVFFDNRCKKMKSIKEDFNTLLK